MITDKVELFTHMSRGATVITPNQRLSTQLLDDFYLHQENIVNDKPRCLPYQTFLCDLFNQLRYLYPHIDHPILLNATQQRFLWKKIILRQLAYPCTEGLLDELHSARTRCYHWNVDILNQDFLNKPQTHQFQQLVLEFEAELIILGAITDAQLVNYYLEYSDVFNGVATIIWAYCDELTPQQQILQEALKKHSYQQYTYELPMISSIAYRYKAADEYAESLQMIEWIKSRIFAGDKRIGIVIPDLETKFKPMQRLFKRHIKDIDLNVSMNKPLIEYPLISHAIAILSIDKQIISNQMIRLLLTSPFLSGARRELNLRSEIMHDSKCLQEANVSFDDFLNELILKIPNFAETLKNIKHYPLSATPQCWANLFKENLISLGFPGEYSLSSSTYLCFHKLMDLFDRLAELSVVNQCMHLYEALDALTTLSLSTKFQPITITPRVQFIDLFDAYGLAFDSIWVSGLTDQCLPQKVKLSAFIPIRLQRESNMPLATSKNAILHAQQLLNSFTKVCALSVFSYPQLTGDMSNLSCPLIPDFAKFVPTITLPILSLTALILREENYVYPLCAAESLSGGTSLLANQAKCPFRAFAAHRLHVKSDQNVSTGLNAGERGQILHQIMELLWRQIGSQQKLKNLTKLELNQYIENTIHTALTPIVSRRSHSCPPLVNMVETVRLKKLIKTCFEWEKKREPFIIDAIEKTFVLCLAGLDFRVRIDRMDALLSGEKWVIDYKTSIPVLKPWNDSRPESPQLLLYALLDDQINTLLFMQIKASRVTCSGLSEDESTIKGIVKIKSSEKLSHLKEQWRTQLTDLAHEFSTGICSPKPHRINTCKQCDYINLCRV